MRLFYSTVRDKTMAVPPDGSLTVEQVVTNRERFIRKCGLDPASVTGIRLGIAGNDRIIRIRNGNHHTIDSRKAALAEAVVTDLPFRVFAAAADCPIVGIRGRKVGGVAHNGWRGAAGVSIDAKASDDLDATGESVLVELVRTIRSVEGSNTRLRAVVSPAVCSRHYTVHHDVARLFEQRYPEFVRPAGSTDDQGELFQLDVSGITGAQLQELEVSDIEESNICTFENPALFSDRRWKKTRKPEDWGRMGVLIIAE
jgi:copper oxidase (laccase) domain-containing protein